MYIFCCYCEFTIQIFKSFLKKQLKFGVLRFLVFFVWHVVFVWHVELHQLVKLAQTRTRW